MQSKEPTRRTEALHGCGEDGLAFAFQTDALAPEDQYRGPGEIIILEICPF